MLVKDFLEKYFNAVVDNKNIPQTRKLSMDESLYLFELAHNYCRNHTTTEETVTDEVLEALHRILVSISEHGGLALGHAFLLYVMERTESYPKKQQKLLDQNTPSRKAAVDASRYVYLNVLKIDWDTGLMVVTERD